MKTIDNYILERLNPRHLGKASEFPGDLDPDKIKDFLKSEGFTEIKSKPTLFSVLKKEFEKYHGLVFSDIAGCIRFADTTHFIISEENPIYEVATSGVLKGYWIEYLCTWEQDLPKEEFFNRLNEKFGWK
jgi:hypothetical protein